MIYSDFLNLLRNTQKEEIIIILQIILIIMEIMYFIYLKYFFNKL